MVWVFTPWKWQTLQISVLLHPLPKPREPAVHLPAQNWLGIATLLHGSWVIINLCILHFNALRWSSLAGRTIISQRAEVVTCIPQCSGLFIQQLHVDCMLKEWRTHIKSSGWMTLHFHCFSPNAIPLFESDLPNYRYVYLSWLRSCTIQSKQNLWNLYSMSILFQVLDPGRRWGLWVAITHHFYSQIT